MKKLMLVLVLMMALMLCACGEEEKKDDTSESGDNVQIQTGNNGGDSTDVELTPTDVVATPTKKPSKVEGPVSGPGSNTGSDKNGTFTKDDCGITVNDVFLTPGMDFTPYIEVVGEDPEILQGQACLEGGYDTNYYYDIEALVVYTYAQDDKQIIYDIAITSGDYPMDKGVKVGVTTREEIAEYYGDPTESALATERYVLDGSSIEVAFTFEDDVLACIDIIDTAVH